MTRTFWLFFFSFIVRCLFVWCSNAGCYCYMWLYYIISCACAQMPKRSIHTKMHIRHFEMCPRLWGKNMLFLTYIKTLKLLFSLDDAYKCIQIISVWIYAENSNINGFCLFIVLTNLNAWSRFIHVLLFIYFYYCLLVFSDSICFPGLIFHSFFYFFFYDLMRLGYIIWLRLVRFPYIFHRSEKHQLYSFESNQWHCIAQACWVKPRSRIHWNSN